MKTNEHQQVTQLSDTDLLTRIYLPLLKQLKKTEGIDWSRKYEVFYGKLPPPHRQIFSILNFCEQATRSTGDLYVYSMSCYEYNLWKHLDEAITYFQVQKLEGVVQVIQGLLMADQSGRNSLALYAFKQIHLQMKSDITVIHKEIATFVRQHKKTFFSPKVLREYHRKRSLTT